MKGRPLLIILFSAVIFLSVSSCKKSIENKIKGTWKKVDATNSDEFDIWRFDDWYIYFVHYKATGSHIDTLSYSYGEYAIKTTHFKRILSITKSTGSIVGDWRINKLNKTNLNIYQDIRVGYFEFTKE
jgi:hypothetical protein